VVLSLAKGFRASWVASLRHLFDDRTRVRALEYIDKVDLAHGDDGLYAARVQGTRREPYEVRIIPGFKQDGGFAACNCPRGITHLACKHLLATLYAIDRQCPDRGHPPGELEHRDVDDEVFGDVGPLRRMRPSHARQLGWRQRARGDWPRTLLAPDLRRAEVEYIVETERVHPEADLHVGARDRVQIVVATVTRGPSGSVRRKLGVDRARVLDDVDRELIGRLVDTRAVESYGGPPYISPAPTYGAVGCQLPLARLAEDLPRLAATGRLGWLPAGDHGELLAPLAWDDGAARQLALVMARAADGLVTVCGELVRDTERVPLSRLQAIAASQVAIVDGRMIRVATTAFARWCGFLAGGLQLAAGDVGAFLDYTCQHAQAPILELGDCGWTLAEPAPTVRTLLTPQGRGYEVTTELRYGDRPASGTSVLIVDERTRQIVRRRFDDEQRFALAAKQIGAPVGRTSYIAGSRLRALVEAATTAGIEVWVAGTRVRAAVDVFARVSSGIDWFDVNIDVGDGVARAGLPELLATVRKNEPFVRLSDGTVVLRPAWLDAHVQMFAHAARPDDGVLRFRRAEILALEQMVAGAGRFDVDGGVTALRDRLDRVCDLAPRLPRREFRAELRDYQRQGLGWLHFLRETGFGGCLADDMGLGKTVQVLALLDAIHAEPGREKRPSLVIAPKSLVFHWVDEARRFAPGLSTLEWLGAAREQVAAQLREVDLVVTTYATLRRDVDRLAQLSFEVVILDEAQAIKNAHSQTAAACLELRAEQRLALTGTPVENRLDDLASIFEFLNPGLLGRASILRELAGTADDLEEARVLGKLLRPFLLRRTKDEVLTELPAKTEQHLSCRLAGKERTQYDELRRHYRQALLPRIEREGVGRSAIILLEALLRLRQAALHPGLLDPARVDESSAKLDALVDQLHEVIASGHRALVFSQFTSMLAIVQRRLDREGIAFEYLDGQTADRRERVAAFQQGNVPVFLLSLKAGGTGLNLTGADHVFLLDPWWNPAVEAQAIDRVHRIGQQRPVSAYRLVAEDTVEAKILALQEHKRALFDNLFEDKGVLARMTVADIKALLD
jgi:superfamily II DNA or RNA helicase